jgi:hypothetical protein
MSSPSQIKMDCPFCGGKPEVHESAPSGQGHDVDHFVVCTKCKAKGPGFAEGWQGSRTEVIAKAVAAWDKRVYL